MATKQTKTVVATLCVVHDDISVLLGKKKLGLGTGKWNAFGGRVEENESIEEAAIRELEEEAGIVAKDTVKHGVLTLVGEIDYDIELHIFKACAFSGDPRESDEMKPQWFKHEEIPFHNMWPNDIYWLPLVLGGKKFKGNFVFKDDKIVDFNLNISDDF